MKVTGDIVFERWCVLVGLVSLCGLFGCDPGDHDGDEFEDQALAAPEEVDDIPELATVSKQVVYVNFDGITIRDCDNYCSDAQSNRSWAIGAHFGGSSKTFSKYGSSSQRDTIMRGLREAFDDYNIDFTTSRPSSGPYTMLIISTSSGPNHGVAPLNCGNTNANDIAFVYKIGNSSTAWITQAAAHELGHSFGLSHVKESRDFMQWAASGDIFSRATWDSNRSVKRCFSGNTQDAPAILKANLGARQPDPVVYDGMFADDDGNIHEQNIEKIARADITRGCGGGQAPKYCPSNDVTRAQMAVFLTRAFDLPAGNKDHFTDDDGEWYERAANAMAESGITRGCGGTKYCGDDTLTRAQMAAFLTRALNLPATDQDFFDDDNGSVFEDAINRMAAAGVTRGCGERKYCPDSNVKRDQMASFLVRALKL